MSKKKDQKNKTKLKRSPKPVLSVVVPFPEDKIVRDRDFENLIRRLRRNKDKISKSPIIVLSLDEDKYFWNANNGVDRKDALWLIELAKLDILGLIEEEEVDE